MKLSKWKHIAIFASVCAVLFFACNHGGKNNKGNQNKDIGGGQTTNPDTPSGTDSHLGNFEELKVHEVPVNKTTFEVEVENKHTKVTATNIQATFKIKGVNTPITVVVVGGEVQLKENEYVDVKLEIPAKKGSYQKWEKTIHVKRLPKGAEPNKDPQLGDPKELTVHSAPVDKTTWKGNVKNDKLEVATGNVVAKFTLNGSEITLQPAVVGGKVQLKENEYVDVKLEIPAVANSYQKWTGTIHVKRLPKGAEPNKDPQAELSSLKIYGKLVSITKLSKDVPQATTKLTKNDVEAKFDIGGKPAKIEVLYNIEGDPVSLNFGENKVKLVVPDAEGKYKGFTKEITINRSNKDPKLELMKLTIHNRPVENINDLTKLQVSVPADKVESKDVKARFEIDGDYKSVTIKVENEPVQLEKDKPIKVTLLVEAKAGEYQEWKHVVKVTKYEGTPIPNITLQSLKIAKKTVNQANWTVIVPKKQESITTSDVEAEFKLGGSKITYPVTVEGTTVNLSETEPTKVKLIVPADGTHGMWEEEVMVTRKDIEPELKNVRIKVSTAPIKYVDLTKTGNKWSAEVPSSFASIIQDSIEAYFEWEGMEMPKPRKLDVTVNPALPIALNEGEEKEVTLSVAAKPEDGLLAFSAPIYITRIASANLQLKKIKLFGTPLTPVNIKDLANPPSITTYAQKAFVSFFSDENAEQEDADLVKKITTEPALTEKPGQGGKLKIWEFTQAQNTLKVSVSGTLVCTLTVNRTPLEVERIGLFDDVGTTISDNVIEGKEYTITKENIQMQVLGKPGLNYKNVSIKIGGNVKNFTKVSAPTDAEESWGSPIIKLEQDENDVEVIIADDVAAFNLVRSFRLKKTTDPTTGPVANKVKIKNLFVGDGAMDILGKNKFSATYVSGDEHRLTVNLPRLGYKNQKVALIVEGETEASAAKVYDDSGAAEGVADGSTVFTSNKTYFDVKANKGKYIFSLKNGSSVATYEVKFNFNVVVKHTITVTQPANGQIKAWYMKAGKRQEYDLTSGKFEVEDGKWVFFELIGSTGHKPKELVVGDQKFTAISTGIAGQTTGEVIACKIDKVLKDLAVTGECN